MYAGYCEIQELTRYMKPIAYSRNANGWKYDVYKIQNVYICTGYGSPKGCKCKRLESAIWKKYVDRCNSSDWIERKKAQYALAQELRDTVKL